MAGEAATHCEAASVGPQGVRQSPGAGASASRRLAVADESASGLLCPGFPCGFTREKPLVRVRGKLPPPPSEAARLTSAASVRRRRMGVANCPGANEREGF